MAYLSSRYIEERDGGLADEVLHGGHCAESLSA